MNIFKVLPLSLLWSTASTMGQQALTHKHGCEIFVNLGWFSKLHQRVIFLILSKSYYLWVRDQHLYPWLTHDCYIAHTNFTSAAFNKAAIYVTMKYSGSIEAKLVGQPIPPQAVLGRTNNNTLDKHTDGHITSFNLLCRRSNTFNVDNFLSSSGNEVITFSCNTKQ